MFVGVCMAGLVWFVWDFKRSMRKREKREKEGERNEEERKQNGRKMKRGEQLELNWGVFVLL